MLFKGDGSTEKFIECHNSQSSKKVTSQEKKTFWKSDMKQEEGLENLAKLTPWQRRAPPVLWPFNASLSEVRYGEWERCLQTWQPRSCPVTLNTCSYPLFRHWHTNEIHTAVILLEDVFQLHGNSRC